MNVKVLTKLRTWISDCHQHVGCNTAKSRECTLPSRIVDVGSSEGSDDPVLVETSRSNNQGRYCALSHCWGARQPITTTKLTIEERKRGISWSKLPQTFKDAIRLTRALAIRYIWIDSLCIVQDDEEDRQRESARMASIYEEAYLTIAATVSADSEMGFLWTRPVYELTGTATCNTGAPSPAVETCRKKHDTNSLPVYVRRQIRHSNLFATEQDSMELHSTDTTLSRPLETRAWCFQERLLSTRVVHFFGWEMFFECKSSNRCECGNMRLQDTENDLKRDLHRVLQGLQIDYSCKASCTCHIIRTPNQIHRAGAPKLLHRRYRPLPRLQACAMDQFVGRVQREKAHLCSRHSTSTFRSCVSNA